MIIHHCPKCEQQTLIPTGGYWYCTTCSFAITQAALIVDCPSRIRQDSTRRDHLGSDAETASEHAM